MINGAVDITSNFLLLFEVINVWTVKDISYKTERNELHYSKYLIHTGSKFCWWFINSFTHFTEKVTPEGIYAYTILIKLNLQYIFRKKRFLSAPILNSDMCEF